MRVLFVTSLMETGGIETNLVGLTRALRSLGHEITVVSSGGDLVGELEGAGARHVRMPLRLQDPLGVVRASIAIARLISRARIDVAHSMSAAGTLALSVARRGRRCRFVASPMGLQNSDREPSFVTQLRNRLLVFRAERVLVISDEIARALREIRVPDARMQHMDLVGIDTGAFPADPAAADRVRGELGIGRDERVVTTIGALHRRKSHDLFLRASSELVPRDRGARFVIVGDGPERRALEGLAVELGIRDRVVFAGRRRDIPAVLAASHVYVKPGVVEGFIGITVLEAMAAGVPVVAFDTRDVRAAIEPERTGLIAPSRDASALASAIERLLREPELVDALARRAREMVTRRFDYQVVAAGLARAYSTMSEPCAE